MADKPTTIHVDEGQAAVPAEPQPAPVSREPEKPKAEPLNPAPADLPKDAEPAMEAQGEEAAAQPSALAQQVAPVAEDTGTSQIDEVLEQLRDARKSASIDDAADDSDIDLETNQIEVGPPRGEELVQLFLRMYPTKESYEAAKADPDSVLSRTINATDHGWGSTQLRDIAECLKEGKVIEKLKPQSDTKKFPGIKDGRPNRVTLKDPDAAGREAIIALKARMGGIVRVNLLNSGFWVALQPPKIDDLQEIFATIDFENREIGRIMGGHFALIADAYLKQKFLETIISKDIIIESNFKQFRKPGAFIRNLAYHDYDTLIHAVVMIMTRGGLRYRCVCPLCGHTSIETIDVGACKFVNEDLWTPEVHTWWNTTVDKEGKLIMHDEKSLMRYRNEVLNRKFNLEKIIDNGRGEKVKIVLEFAEPTFKKYIDVSTNLIRTMMNTINSISRGDDDRADLARNTLSVHNYQQIAPWINFIRVYGEDGVLDIQSSDASVILSYLDELSQHDKEMSKALSKFIADTRFNWIGTQSIECPNCHARPSEEMNGFYPLEIQTIFFGLLSRLWQAGG